MNKDWVEPSPLVGEVWVSTRFVAQVRVTCAGAVLYVLHDVVDGTYNHLMPEDYQNILRTAEHTFSKEQSDQIERIRHELVDIRRNLQDLVDIRRSFQARS